MNRPMRGIKVAADTDRFGGTFHYLNCRMDCKVSANDTDGAFCVFDTLRTAKGGPPLHIHHDQDEWFYVREGEFIFQVGDDTFHLKPGDSLLGPRKVPHAFANLTETGILMIVFQPAGTIEQFFVESCEVSTALNPPMAEWQTIARRHGMEFVGPPLTDRRCRIANRNEPYDPS